jgi:hypothetical protein
MMTAERGTEGTLLKRGKSQQIITSQKKADAIFLAKIAEKIDTFRTLARTEYQLLHAKAVNDEAEIERLHNQRPGHTVQVTS